jgi:hypothetical protein
MPKIQYSKGFDGCWADPNGCKIIKYLKDTCLPIGSSGVG